MTLTREMTGRARWRGGGHFVEGAVDAVADLEFVFEGFEVDVGGAVLHGLEEDEVDEADDGPGVGRGFHGGDVVAARAGFEEFAGVAEFVFEALEDFFHGGVFGAVVAGDGGVDGVGGVDGEEDVLGEDEVDFVGGLGGEEVAAGEGDGIAVGRDGDDGVHAGDGAGDGLEDVGGDAHVLEVDALGAHELGDDVEDLVGGEQPEFDGDVLDGLAGALVFVGDLGGLGFVDDAVADEFFEKHVGVFGHGGGPEVTGCCGWFA